MFTRCPHCRTVFRVTPQQLQASSGQVRCGRCQAVFDAFATLSARFPVAAPTPAPAREQELPPDVGTRRPSSAGSLPSAQGAAPPVHGAEAAPCAHGGEAAPPAPGAEAAPGGGEAAAATLTEHSAEPPSSDTTPGLPADGDRGGEGDLDFTGTGSAARTDEGGSAGDDAGASVSAVVRPPVRDDEEVLALSWQERASHAAAGGGQALHLPEDVMSAPDAAARRRRSRWLAIDAALVVLALLQALWVFATPIALALPASRSFLEAYCSVSGCTVALPQLPDQLFIEASDLQLVNPLRPNEVLLTATIRNRAALAQQLPLLELTLIAGANQTAARKVFRPDEYVQKRNGAERGIGANQEVEIRLYLNTGNILPSGYRLFLFFA